MDETTEEWDGANPFPQPDAEMRELADRMAADESVEGNFGAAAELKAFADGAPIGVAAENISAGGTGTVNLSPTTGLPAWMTGRDADLRAITASEPPARSRTDEEQALAGDLEDLLPQLRDVASVLTYRANWLARMLIDRGWVLAARGRVEGTPTKPAALRPGQLIREWGVADRVEKDGIRFGVDGPLGYPLRLVVEDGELRLRQDRSAEPQTPDEGIDRG